MAEVLFNLGEWGEVELPVVSVLASFLNPLLVFHRKNQV